MILNEPIYFYEPLKSPLIATSYDDLRAAFVRQYEDDLANSEMTLYRVLASHKPLIDYLDTMLNQHQKSGTPLRTAVVDAIDELMHIFSTSDVEPSRFDDVIDVSRRLYLKQHPAVIDSPSILLADTLFPSDLISIPMNKITGIWVRSGSLTSHVALIADSLNISYRILGDTEWFSYGMYS